MASRVSLPISWVPLDVSLTIHGCFRASSAVSRCSGSTLQHALTKSVRKKKNARKGYGQTESKRRPWKITNLWLPARCSSRLAFQKRSCHLAVAGANSPASDFAGMAYCRIALHVRWFQWTTCPPVDLDSCPHIELQEPSSQASRLVFCFAP